MAILRIPRSDDASSFVLLNIPPSSSEPTLAAKIVGTDGASAFLLQLKPALADRARASKAACTAEEWTTILKSVLLTGLTPEDVEVTATVEENVAIQVVFRKTFEGGLKQRLGSLSLKYDEDEAIELLDWCAALAARAAEQAKELERERSKVAKLVKESQELVKAKEEAEKEVVGKCMRLVNSKKAKIAELQSRLSKYEKGDPLVGEPMEVEEQAEEVVPKKGRGKGAAKGKGKEKATPAKTTLPRRGKRAAPESEPEEDDGEPAKGEENGNEDDMDVDQDEANVETEGETEGEDTPSDHSLEDEVPEVRARSESQIQSQNRAQKNASSPKEAEHEAPHVTTRAASHSQHHKKGASKGEGSETESDDEL